MAAPQHGHARRRTDPVGRLTSAVVDTFDWPDDPDDPTWFLDTPEFEQLYQAVAKRDDDRISDLNGAIVDLQEQLKAALPAHLAHLVDKLDELDITNVRVHCEAAYFLGIAVARRMAGGAR